MHFELGHGMTGKHFCNFGQRSLQFTMTHISSTRLFLRADNKTPHKSTSVPNTLETRIGSRSSELEGKIGAHHPQAQFTFVKCAGMYHINLFNHPAQMLTKQDVLQNGWHLQRHDGITTTLHLTYKQNTHLLIILWYLYEFLGSLS